MAGMRFDEQVGMIARLRILSGVYGAGLSHIFFLTPGSGVLEVRFVPHQGSQVRKHRQVHRYMGGYVS